MKSLTYCYETEAVFVSQISQGWGVAGTSWFINIQDRVQPYWPVGLTHRALAVRLSDDATDTRVRSLLVGSDTLAYGLMAHSHRALTLTPGDGFFYASALAATLPLQCEWVLVLALPQKTPTLCVNGPLYLSATSCDTYQFLRMLSNHCI